MLKMQDGRPLIVPEPVMRPNSCALSPQITRDPGGFIDTGTKLAGVSPRVYVSMSGLRDLVRSLGWPSPEEHATVTDRVAALEAELAQALATVAERDETLAAVEVLQSAGYTTAKSAARRPAKAKVTA